MKFWKRVPRSSDPARLPLLTTRDESDDQRSDVDAVEAHRTTPLPWGQLMVLYCMRTTGQQTADT